MLGTTIAACPGHDRISQHDDYRIADKRGVPSQPIPQATRSSEFIWDRSLSRDTLDRFPVIPPCIWLGVFLGSSGQLSRCTAPPAMAKYSSGWFRLHNQHVGFARTFAPRTSSPVVAPFRICLQVGRPPAAWSGYNFGDV